MGLYTIAASDDDAHESADLIFSDTSPSILVRSSTLSSLQSSAGFVFHNVLIPNAATIQSAVLELYINSTGGDDPECDIYCEDIDNAQDFTSNPTVVTRTVTTATTAWDDTGLGIGYTDSADFTSSLQEVVDRGFWASGNSLCVLLFGRATGSGGLLVDAYDATNAPRLRLAYVGEGDVITDTGRPKYIRHTPVIRGGVVLDDMTPVGSAPSLFPFASPFSIGARRTYGGVKVRTGNQRFELLDGHVPIPEDPVSCPGSALITQAGPGSAILSGTSTTASEFTATVTATGPGSAILIRGCE